MKEAEVQSGCTERFSELCALATSGALTAEESKVLEAHLARCPECAKLMVEYRALAFDGMAKLAAARDAGANATPQDWNRKPAKDAFLGAVAGHAPGAAREVRATKRSASLFSTLRFSPIWVHASVASVAVLVLAVAIGFRVGYKRGADSTTPISRTYQTLDANLSQRLVSTVAERDALKRAANDATERANLLQQQEARAEKQVSEVETARASLADRLQALSAQNQQQASAVAELTGERASLQKQLQAADDTLRTVRENLDNTQQEHQRTVLRAASLQSEVDRLSADLRDSDQATHRDRQYLASDRDIRELMGARQLYIADVFDVDSQGKAKKPFGRVFYTKGKSLIFYAFDLDHEPGFRDAKAFQAWGRSGATDATPVSLGIFYMDNATNRRWAIQFDNPKVLDEINAVFVTVEPKGGSKRPTGKPFLLAYLHSASVNHP